jgi:hypothetical protein
LAADPQCRTKRPELVADEEVMSRYVLKVCFRFSAGGALGALGGVLVFPAGLITYPLGGAIAGRALDRGRRPARGFAIAFLFLGLAIPLILIAPQGMSADWAPLVHFTIALPIAFGFAGTLGSALGGLGFRVSLLGGTAFAVGGAVGGLILGLPFLTGIGIGPRSGAGGVAAVVVCSFVALVLPHALGGTVIAALLHPIRMRQLGLCVKCGYDVRASIARCPECGEPIASTRP